MKEDISINQVLAQFSNREELYMDAITFELPSNISLLNRLYYKDIVLDKMKNLKLIVEHQNKIFKITDFGKEVLRKGNWIKFKEKRNGKERSEELIREKTIEKFKYEKLSFWISVIAIIIAGLSFLMTILK